MVTFWTAKIELLFETEKRNGNFFYLYSDFRFCSHGFGCFLFLDFATSTLQEGR